LPTLNLRAVSILPNEFSRFKKIDFKNTIIVPRRNVQSEVNKSPVYYSNDYKFSFVARFLYPGSSFDAALTSIGTPSTIAGAGVDKAGPFPTLELGKFLDNKEPYLTITAAENPSLVGRFSVAVYGLESGGLLSQYWKSIDNSVAPAFESQQAGAVNFNWSDGREIFSVGGFSFTTSLAARFSGFIKPEASGTYTISVSCNSPDIVSIKFDGASRISACNGEFTTSLVSSRFYHIQVDFVRSSSTVNSPELILRWQSADAVPPFARIPIPSKVFSRGWPVKIMAIPYSFFYTFQGLKAEYFSTDDFSGPPELTQYTTFPRTWGENRLSSPFPGAMSGDTFSVRFSGFYHVPRSGQHKVYAMIGDSDDTVRLYINDMVTPVGCCGVGCGSVTAGSVALITQTCEGCLQTITCSTGHLVTFAGASLMPIKVEYIQRTIISPIEKSGVSLVVAFNDADPDGFAKAPARDSLFTSEAGAAESYLTEILL
jgi:hypothetical protein